VNDEQLVVAMLTAAGISPSPEEIASLVDAYPRFKGMVDAVHGVEAARYEDMCLTFQAEASFTDWG
jgi:hypothetical protein